MRSLFLLTSILTSSLMGSTAVAESYSLKEPLSDGRTYQVQVSVQGKGTLETPTQEKTALEMPLEVQASAAFYERRLASAGRDERAWRSLRKYDNARSDIKVRNQVTNLRLASTVRDVICEGRREGILYYTADMPMRRVDLDLLTTPGDPLALLSMLPAQEVEVGDTWSVPQWAAQMFVAIEAATSTEITGKLLSVENDIATMQFTGEVSGATAGATSKIIINGTATFDIARTMLTSLKLIQQEERSISTVSPGIKVTATVQWKRTVSESAKISDGDVEGIPFDPPTIASLLLFQSKHWDVSFIHDRTWYVFQETPEVVVLRMVENGSLISQCNIARIGDVQPGEHASPQKFENDIRVSLGDQFSQIADQQELRTESGLYINRVVAAGSANGLDMAWIYYLCAAESGRQLSFVYAVESSNLEALSGRDLSIVESVEFLPAE